MRKQQVKIARNIIKRNKEKKLFEMTDLGVQFLILDIRNLRKEVEAIKKELNVLEKESE